MPPHGTILTNGSCACPHNCCRRVFGPFRGEEVFTMLIYCFVSAPRRYHIMDTNKVSNLFSYLRDKCGRDSVKLHRYWKVPVKKMVDYSNQRRFTLRCNKVGITPVSCRIRIHLKTTSLVSIVPCGGAFPFHPYCTIHLLAHP